MQAGLKTKIWIGFATALVFSLGAVALSYRSTAKLLDTNRLVTRTNDAITNLGGTIAALDNIERSRLAWVMAGVAMHNLRARRARQPACGLCHSPHSRPVEDERFHNTHLEMVAALAREMQGLRTLIASEPAQRERLGSLESLVQQKVALAKEEIPSEKPAGLSELSADGLERDAHLTTEIRKVIADMAQTESRLLAQELQDRTATARSEIFAVSLLGFLTICAAVVAYLLIHRDLARRQALEERLRQTMKMEAVGRLAGGVAHDFNNLLVPILWSAETLRNTLDEDDPMMEYVKEIRKAGETAASVTRQLLAFSRKQTFRPQKLNLNTIAADMSYLLKRLVGEQYQFETVLEPGLGWVEAEPSQVEQVIMNLVLNARDAMPRGGIIAVETANVNLHGERSCWCGLPLSGAYVVLAVSDDGVGMDTETCSQIFEPFFTTKERGKGTGLGLATVYGIIAQSNGRVRVQSAVGRGTAFEVYLPRVEPPAESAQQPPQMESRILGTRATILLVEDDEAINRLLGKTLTAGGYHVLQAHNGEEGLQAAQSFKKRIDLLISDVMMPRLNGLELRHKLMVLHPGLRTVLMSGHTADSVHVADILDEETRFLAKPFTPSVLLEKVGQLLTDTNRTKVT